MNPKVDWFFNKETRWKEEYSAGYISCEKDLETFSHELVIKIADKIEELFLKKWETI